MDSTKKYIENIIYGDNYQIRTPTSQDDVPYQIQTLVFLYKENPEWQDNFKQDIQEYVKKCIDRLDKV